jgi:hypothetical protein
MGLLDGLLGGGDPRIDDPVRGSAQVVAASSYRGRGVMQNCHMQLVISGDGVPATAVEFQGLVHNSRWPSPGMVLPATVDRADPRRYRIEWDEVQSSRDRSRQSAEGMAAAMRGDGAPPSDLAALSEDQKAKLRMLGLDPDAVEVRQAAPAADDRLGKLERLAKLHEQGILSDEELAAEKKRILES